LPVSLDANSAPSVAKVTIESIRPANPLKMPIRSVDQINTPRLKHQTPILNIEFGDPICAANQHYDIAKHLAGAVTSIT
jgi:hypothetical protein